MLVEVGHLLARQGLQLRDRADADHVVRVGVVDPDRDATAPEAVARNVPVARLLQPVAEALLADVGGRPVDGRVVLRETFVQVFDAHVPGVDRAVDERRVGAVAEGVRVGDCRLVDELALGLEPLDDVLVAVLAEAPLVFGDLVRECAGRVERIDDGLHAGGLADAEVVLAVGRGDVDEARAVVGRHVVVVEDAERALGGLVGVVREDRLVARPLQRVALELGDELVLLRLLEERREPRLRHDVDRPRVVGEVAHGDVVDRRARADHQVLRQRPRRRRPDEEIDGGEGLGGLGSLEGLGSLGGWGGLAVVGRRLSFVRHIMFRQALSKLPKLSKPSKLSKPPKLLNLHPDRDGRVLHVLVVRAGLEVGERRRELPGVRHDAVGAVDAPLLPELLEDPPDRFHEFRLHRLVVVVEIDPAAHARDGLAPFRDVLQHHRAALLVELVHAQGLDLGRARDAERVLREGLDGQAVRVPPEAALDVLSAHRLVARHDVLDRAGEQVAVVRQARRERRPVVERVARLARVALEGLLKSRILLPDLEDLLLHLRKRDLVRDRLEHLLEPFVEPF